jgi:hypothetical protein
LLFIFGNGDLAQTKFEADDATTSSEIKEKALELIELEQDLKYKKKYATVWKKV